MWTAESQISQRISDLQITGAFLSALHGMSNSRLAMGLRGDAPFPRETADGLLRLTEKLIELRDAVAPIPLKLTNAVEVRALLDAMRRNYVEPSELRSAINKVFENSGSSQS